MGLVQVFYEKKLICKMECSLIRNIQLLQMAIMDDIHRVCVLNKLRYYLIGGSALGAVRHGGFIPWDPDIDIAMPREDYELFVTQVSDQLDPKFSCHSHYTDDIYFPPHALVVLNGSKLVGASGMMDKSIRPSEIYVDILPLDSWPINEALKIRQQKKLIAIKNIKYRKANLIYEENSFITKFIKYSLKVMLSAFSWRFLNELQQKEMMKYDYQKSDEWCSMASHYKFSKLTMNKRIFGTPKLMKFEDREYYVPEQVEEYLYHLFGDYMKLPSKDTQEHLRNLFVSAEWPEGIIQ